MKESENSKEILAVTTALEMLDNDKELYQMLLDSFIHDTPFSTDHIQKLVTSGQNEEGAKYIHRVKGAARQLGAQQFSESAQNLENILRGKSEEAVMPVLNTVISDYDCLLEAINKIILPR